MDVDNLLDFIREYPIGTVITIEEYDQFIIDRGIAEDPETSDKSTKEWGHLVKQRNNSRTALNKAATDTKLLEPELRFNLRVHQSGVDYKVMSVSEVYVSDFESLETKISTFCKTQAVKATRLSECTEVTLLPPVLQMELKSLGKEGARLQRGIMAVLDEFSRSHNEVMGDIRKVAKDNDWDLQDLI